jgi:hypothetical protein
VQYASTRMLVRRRRITNRGTTLRVVIPCQKKCVVVTDDGLGSPSLAMKLGFQWHKAAGEPLRSSQPRPLTTKRLDPFDFPLTF